ncbi:hypothetical protein RND71_020736 [Anisodus tanguticus]|uniref:ubiquitinyl hydrolase 1 n=1 Tax=Anisodus tanguticus TaxID=243964 RepID=A0AAE1V7N5_9SOLA|nr:hypothetical protein RND71_020736 [Anisodus tanguticus]
MLVPRSDLVFEGPQLMEGNVGNLPLAESPNSGGKNAHVAFGHLFHGYVFADIGSGKGSRNATYPQPAKVYDIQNSVDSQAETGNDAEKQPPEDPQTSRFTWKIENFSRLNVKKLYSDTFVVGGYKWRILTFPKGNNVDYLSMYLDVADSASLPYGWSIYALFSLTIVNQIHNKYSIRKVTVFVFCCFVDCTKQCDQEVMSLSRENSLCRNARYKFDDERVTKEDLKRVLEEQYGGEEELPQTNPGFNNTPFKFTKYSNAYMLVYIRESDKKKIMCSVGEKDIAEHVRARLKREQEEKDQKKKEKAEAHLYTIIQVARDEDVRQQIGKDIHFDLVDHDKVRIFRIQKQTLFSIFKEEVAKEFGVPVQFQCFWLWAKRQNHTYRPNRPLTHLEEAQTVGQLREVSNKVQNAELKLFSEVELGLDLRHIPPPDKTKDDILLFCKLYDAEKEELRYAGRLFVKGTSQPTEILNKLNEMVGYAPDQEIELYEIGIHATPELAAALPVVSFQPSYAGYHPIEIKFERSVMCEIIDKKSAFRSSQLEDGDIVCYQKSLSPESRQKFRYPDVPSFLEYVYNRRVVHFRSLEKSKEEDFSLELSKINTYDEVVERVAQQLGLDDPSKIRLTPHNCYSQQSKPQPIKYCGVDTLEDMLVHYNQTSDILYNEVLDIPLPELQGLKTLKVAFHHATKDENFSSFAIWVVNYTIRLPKQSTVGDVINDLKTKVELSSSDAELRLLEVFYHKIYKIFPTSEKIENINDQSWTLRAEEIPEEEKNLGPNDHLIHVYHFTKETAQNQMQIQNFREPFLLVIYKGETLAQVNVRIQKKLQVPDEEFAKWKFAFLSLGRPEYLEDSDILSNHFQRRDVYGAWEQYLGLEHPDSAPKRPHAACQDEGKLLITSDLSDLLTVLHLGT